MPLNSKVIILQTYFQGFSILRTIKKYFIFYILGGFCFFCFLDFTFFDLPRLYSIITAQNLETSIRKKETNKPKTGYSPFATAHPLPSLRSVQWTASQGLLSLPQFKIKLCYFSKSDSNFDFPFYIHISKDEHQKHLQTSHQFLLNQSH